jgi:MraZ protein
LFLGHHPRLLDTSNRLLPPAEFGEYIADGAYLTQGFDRNLLVLTASAFQEIYECVMSLSITDPVARLLLRMVLGTACELEVSPDGKITIPERLKNFAGLERDVVLVGQGDYFEVWSPGQWRQQEDLLSNAEMNAQRFSMFSIATR